MLTLLQRKYGYVVQSIKPHHKNIHNAKLRLASTSLNITTLLNLIKLRLMQSLSDIPVMLVHKRTNSFHVSPMLLLYIPQLTPPVGS